jgi:hypothetical protein
VTRLIAQQWHKTAQDSLHGSYYKTVPFGWDYAPIIAHEPSFSGALHLERWHTYIIWMTLSCSIDPDLLTIITTTLRNFLRAKGLLISKKNSCVEPSIIVCWIGKCFNLMDMVTENLPIATLKSIATAIKVAVQSLTPKRIERMTGWRH